MSGEKIDRGLLKRSASELPWLAVRNRKLILNCMKHTQHHHNNPGVSEEVRDE